MDKDEEQSSKEVGSSDGSNPNATDLVNRLRKLIFLRMRVGIKDGRSFTGALHCIDKQGNIILQDAMEHRSSRRMPDSPAGKSGGYGTGFLVTVLLMKNVAFAVLTCLLALGGSMVGTVIGAMNGHTTETGLIGGAGIGVVTGAIIAMQLLESVVNGDTLCLAAILGSLASGKVFMEWVSPAVLKAYQWQVSVLGTTYRDITDIYDTFEAEARGLSYDCIKQFSEFTFHSSKMLEPFNIQPCSICLQDFVEGERARRLPKCQHVFHMGCIDEWLKRQGSCPMCRQCVCDEAS